MENAPQTPKPEGAAPAPEAPPEAAPHTTPQPTPRKKKREITASLRAVMVVGLFLIIFGSLWQLYRGIRARPIPDTAVRVRDQGGAIAVYPGVAFGAPIYYFAPGSRIYVGDVRRYQGKPRYPVFLPIEDGLLVVGYVEVGDLVADDVEAAKVRLDAESHRF
jgi:hypothetical protein